MYLTDNTSPEDVAAADEAGVVAFKLYPAGATTNSDSGVTDWKKCLPTLKAMEAVSKITHCIMLNSISPYFIFTTLAERTLYCLFIGCIAVCEVEK